MVPFESLYTVSYLHSIVIMAVTCIVFSRALLFVTFGWGLWHASVCRL